MKSPEPATIREALADLRARGFTPKLVWAANPEGDRLGDVPEGWDKDWPEVPKPAPTHPWRASQPGQFRPQARKPGNAPGRMR